MTNTISIINAIGSETVQALCGVGEFSVRAARRDNQFPSSWFDLIEKACIDAGVDCPRDLFAFKRDDAPIHSRRAVDPIAASSTGSGV